MAQFIKHRQTALILALFATLLASPMLTGSGNAGSISGNGGSPEPGSPGDGKGDPDVPTGPARVKYSGRVSYPGAQRVGVYPSREALTVGDGRVPYGAWMWRLRIVLQGLKAYTFRF